MKQLNQQINTKKETKFGLLVLTGWQKKSFLLN